jgi:hypothetical protein
MTPHVLLSLMLASPPTPMSIETVRTLDLGKMTVAEAKRLDGTAVRVTLVAASVPDGLALEQSIDAVGDKKATRSVRFKALLHLGPIKLGQRITVEGVLRTRFVPAMIIGGEELFPENQFIEVRDARPIKP